MSSDSEAESEGYAAPGGAFSALAGANQCGIIMMALFMYVRDLTN